MKQLVYRPLHLIGGISLALLVVSFAVVAAASWRNLERARRVERHVGFTGRLQQLGLRIESAQPISATADRLDRGRLEEARRALAELRGSADSLAPGTPAELARIEALLARAPADPGALRASLTLLRDLLAAETRADLELLRGIHQESRFEVALAAALLGAFAGLAALALFLLRRRVLTPLDELRELLSRLASGEHRPLPTAGADPLLMPVIANYNRLAASLAELEEVRRSRTETLEREVRAATETVLEQQAGLARAERLAAVGEMSASLAHELRNPLAGIQMALANLRRDADDPDRRERLARVAAELDRIARLVDQMLAGSRHLPEPARRIDAGRVVGDLLALTRYQVPDRVTLAADLPPDLEARLPADRFRQAVLNLVLNSAQALGERPGAVRVAVRRTGGDLEVEVADDGPGFPPELLNGGIRPFASGRPGGTGLGLALARRFARDAGGALTLANREPRGAVATLRIPLGEPGEVR